MMIRSWQRMVACCLLVLASTAAVATAKQDGPVQVTSKVESVEGKPSHYKVLVNLQVEEGWHTYASVPEGESAILTSVKVKVPEGVKKIGKLSSPTGTPDVMKPGVLVYEGDVSFSQVVEIPAGLSNLQGQASVFFQVCNEKLCRPPVTIKSNFTLPSFVSFSSKKDSVDSLFEEPEMLMVGDKPLNTKARQMYPSPAIFDVDNDGVNELVVGDIFGSLNVYENKNAGTSGDPSWAPFISLKSEDGKKIKVSNW